MMDSSHFHERPSLVVVRSLRRTLWAGATITGLFYFGLGAWSAQAPLAGAAVAPAVTSPDGNRREVQHLEGGIVRELLVREGDAVVQGRPLVIIDSSTARANRDVLREEFRTLLALRARWVAERDQAAEIVFPQELPADVGGAAAKLIETQRALFHSRRDSRHQRRRILEQQLRQLEETIVGIAAQIESQDRQLRLVRDEAKGVSALVRQQLEPLPRLLALQRSEAELAGAKASAQAAAARARQAMGETQAQIVAIQTQHMEEVGTKLAEIEAALPVVREKLRAATEIVDRTVVSAPITGTVVELKARTLGGVIAPGQTILEIVPRDEEILFDARISPNDIDEVVPGLAARIVLTGYPQRTIPTLTGTVRQVSADRIVDPKTNQPYYLARIEMAAEHVRTLPPHVTLKPGMPAEVMVMTGERTVLDYLIEPLMASIRKSFREN